MPWDGANGLLPGRGEPGRPEGRAGGGPGRRVVDSAGASSGRGLGRPRSSRPGPTRPGPRRPARPRARRGAGVGAWRGPGRGPDGADAGAGVAAGAAGASGAAAAGGASVVAGAADAAGSRGLGRLLTGRGLGTRLGGSGLLGRTVVGARLQLGTELVGEPLHHGGLDRRRRRLDELSHFFELGQDDLALDSELFGELVDSDLSHASPSGPSPGTLDGRRGAGRTVSWCACSSESTHRVLMSCCSNFCRSHTGQWCWCRDGPRPPSWRADPGP